MVKDKTDHKDGTCHHFPNYCNCLVSELATELLKFRNERDNKKIADVETGNYWKPGQKC